MHPSILRTMAAGLCLIAWGATPLAAAGPGERYAFLVGVKEYDTAELNSLKYSEADVVALAETLGRVGYPPENISLLTQRAGTKARFLPLRKNIVDELAKLLNILHPEDSIVVAFAGHGVQFKGERQAYFCPMDAKLAERETLVPLETVYDLLDKSRAGTKVLLVDACRNDPQSALSRTASRIELEAAGKPQAAPPAGVLAIFSCSDGELAFEHPDLQHGVFFYHVIAALRGEADADGDREVTLDEVKSFATRRVQKFVLRELGRNQTPMLRGELRGAPTLAVLSAGAASKPPLVMTPGTPEPSPLPARPMPAKLDGTTWQLIGGNKLKSLITFRADGTLIHDQGDGFPKADKWRWVNGRVQIDLNGGEYTLEGVVQEGKLEGKGGNRQGEGFAWSATPYNGPPLALRNERPGDLQTQATDLARTVELLRRHHDKLVSDRRKLLSEQANYSKDDPRWVELDKALTLNQRDLEAIRKKLQEDDAHLADLERRIKAAGGKP